MRDIFTLFLHVIVTIIRLGRPGGLRSVIAESVLMRYQILILNRGRKRAPNLRSSDRIIAGLCTLFMRPARVLRSAIVLKTSTLLHFHKILVKQKYRLLFSPKRVRRPGPKGPTKELIDAVVEMKRRNRTWGCKRIAQQIALAFGVDINKDVSLFRHTSYRFCSLWINPSRFFRVATAFKLLTLLKFHRALVNASIGSYFRQSRNEARSESPTADLVRAVVEMKQRNSTWGCPHLADQINLAFGTSINKDVVRRILALHYRPMPTEGGPSWPTSIGHTNTACLASTYFDTVVLGTYWVLVVINQYMT
jgi:hypothetical protein